MFMEQDAIFKIQNRGKKKRTDTAGGPGTAPPSRGSSALDEFAGAPMFQRQRTQSAIEVKPMFQRQRTQSAIEVQPMFQRQRTQSAIEVHYHPATTVNGHQPSPIEVNGHHPATTVNGDPPSEEKGSIQVATTNGMLPPPRPISEESAYEDDHDSVGDAAMTMKDKKANFEEDIWMTEWKFDM
ncbi:hypothetical protein CYMTET_29527 [Cymbomonas tetramitiformis]|uniref:Uncharacterized protein n=1 Tax=Cymbomonas tetramitiformis TaxID=36881 RepID=A0AAE0FKW2_9CHLO|nr:hypothetical protein CYMTET_29527 [Cymbomonas tetramitiformis]